METKVWKILSIILGLLFFVALIFIFLFGFRIAKNNEIKASELSNSLKKQESDLNKAFQTEREKTVAKYVAEDLFGAFEFSYPKVWFTNMKRSESDPQIRFLADPSLIVMKDEQGPETALRVIVYTGSYADKAKSAESEIKSKKLAVTVEDVTLSGLQGKKFIGKTSPKDNTNRAYVLLPLREKTLYIGTDNYDLYKTQFETILKSFKISR